MLAILNFLNAHNLPIFQPILMILVSKYMVHRALSDKTCLPLGLLSPLSSFFTLPLLFVYLLHELNCMTVNTDWFPFEDQRWRTTST